MSDSDIIILIEEKIQKEKDKLIHDWSEAGIRVEKARWGRFNLIKGKSKVELPKDTNVEKLTLEDVLVYFSKKKTKKTK